MFGGMFFDFCQESGYQNILQVLGSTTRDFLQNLDVLHDHLATIYPGMRAPSFCCSAREEDGATILHYYSEREGLEFIVIGLVKAVAKKLHRSDVNVQIYKTKDDGIDHVQFLITEKSADVENQAADLNDFEGVLSTEPKISPDSFARAFPFHMMYDRHLNIVQSGRSISRLMPKLDYQECAMTDLFTLTRPRMDFTFKNVCSHVNTVYVLSTKPGVMRTHTEEVAPNGRHTLRLKGEMVWVPEAESILFLCSPSDVNLDDLSKHGLYLSDIPLHDATRDLRLLSEQFRAQYKLTTRLEVLTDQLQQTYRELEDEKKRTDRRVQLVRFQSHTPI